MTTSTYKIKKRSLFTLGAVAALGALCLDTKAVDAAVMSIDYGTDWFKVALVKPGIPLDIVLNAESKRKTQSAITVRGDDRAFGSEALSLVWFFCFVQSRFVPRSSSIEQLANILFFLFGLPHRPPASPKTRTLDSRES